MTTYVLTVTYQSTRGIAVALSDFLYELVRDGMQYLRQLPTDDLRLRLLEASVNMRIVAHQS